MFSACNSPPRKGAFSVADTARLCRVSRSRFYDLMKSGVMPQPVYCIFTRRPMYTTELAAMCMRVRESNIGIDGRYVLFYERRADTGTRSQPRREPARRPAVNDPLREELIDALRAMGVRCTEQEIGAAITERCPTGVQEDTFEVDLRAIFDRLRCRDVG